MNLANVTATIRPRTPTEAMDLGVALAREFRWPLLRAWFLVIVPVATIAWLVCTPLWATFVVWWLKPLYDRVPLFVLSRALFGAVPAFRATARAIPRLLLHDPISALTIGRLSPWRSFLMPVRELEGLKGRAAHTRRQVLMQGESAGAFSLLLSAAVLEQCLTMAGLALLFWYAPQSTYENWQGKMAQGDLPFTDPTSSFVAYVAYVLALSIVENLYVAAGFALYLNRRTWLEGWDVELAFKRLANRITTPARRTAGRAMPGLLLGLLALLCPSAAPAQEPGVTPARPKAAIEKVLADPAFQTKIKVRERASRADSPGFSSSNRDVGEGVATLVQVTLWTGLVFVLGATLYWLVRRLPEPTSAKAAGRTQEAPEQLFGLDLRSESLPDDPAQEARRLWEAGAVRSALALLYRAALANLTRTRKLQLRASHTEGDCVAEVGKLGDEELATFFTRLTRAWQQAAYAHATPAREEVAALCTQHPSHFGGTR